MWILKPPAVFPYMTKSRKSPFNDAGEVGNISHVSASTSYGKESS